MDEDTKLMAMLRKDAGQLVDILKRSENADILEQLIAYDAQKEHGWSNFIAYDGVEDEVPAMLTPEQSKRWQVIEAEVDKGQHTGSTITAMFLLAQSILGRLDVWNKPVI